MFIVAATRGCVLYYKSVMKRNFFATILVCALVCTPLARAYAADFNPHLILTDADMTASSSMSATDVQQFLVTQNSGLAPLRFPDSDGTTKSAAEIIVAAAQDAQISPRYLLVLLQKEQSLITDATPAQKQLDWATGFGVCDSCALSDSGIQKFKGFATQVRDAANVMRYYYDNLTQPWIKRAGGTYTIDNVTVSPQSNATAFLYTYTPHVSGNKNLWQLWNQWFTKIFPDGSLVQAVNDSVVYVLQQGKRRPLASKAVLLSRYNPNLVLSVNPSDIVAYQIGAPIAFPNYSLVRAPNGMVFLLVDDVKRPIASQTVFKTLGFNPGEIVDVSDDDLASYTNGNFLTSASVYPLGAVVQERKSKTLYYVKDGVRYVLPSPDVARVNFPHKKIVTIGMSELAQYDLGQTQITFQDGTLLGTKTNPAVYVVSNGQARPIPSEGIFTSLGYQWKNVVYTDEQTLAALPVGSPLTDVKTVTHAATK